MLIAISVLLPSASYLLFLQPSRPAPPAVPVRAAAPKPEAAAPKPEAAPVVSAVEALPKEEVVQAPSAPAQSVATRPPPRREGASKVAKGAFSPNAAAAMPRGEAGERGERGAPSATPSDANGASAPPSASARVRVLLEESHRAKVLE